MSYEQEREIIRSFAYGMTAEHIADVEDMNIEDVKAFYNSHISEIEEEKEYCIQKGGTFR